MRFEDFCSMHQWISGVNEYASPSAQYESQDEDGHGLCCFARGLKLWGQRLGIRLASFVTIFGRLYKPTVLYWLPTHHTCVVRDSEPSAG
jgi:hypothetical protein